MAEKMSATLEKAVNVASMVGWGVVLSQLFPFSGPLDSKALHYPMLGLEGLCCFEVYRMLTGSLQGKWILGLGLHATRCVGYT